MENITNLAEIQSQKTKKFIFEMSCVACGSSMLPLPKDLHTCSVCGLISSDIDPDPSIYDRSYEIKYSRYENTPIGREIQNLRCEVVRRHLKLGPEYNLLDFGCGVGSFVKFMDTDHYINVEGFDINPYVKFCDISVLFKRYNVVTFWDSLEHLRDPVKIIRGLNPEYLFICSPSTDDWDGDITQWRHYMPQEHCHYFNKLSLTVLLEDCGYKVLEVTYDESKLRRGGGDKNIITIAAKKEG